MGNATSPPLPGTGNDLELVQITGLRPPTGRSRKSELVLLHALYSPIPVRRSGDDAAPVEAYPRQRNRDGVRLGQAVVDRLAAPSGHSSFARGVPLPPLRLSCAKWLPAPTLVEWTKRRSWRLIPLGGPAHEQ